VIDIQQQTGKYVEETGGREGKGREARDRERMK
jgi:hypothetical protein